MNVYPSTRWAFASGEPVSKKEIINEATNGGIHQVILGADDNRVVEVNHYELTRAQYDAWLAFRAANLGQDVILERTRGGVVESYVGLMAAGFHEEYVSPGLFNIKQKLYVK